MTTRCRCRRRRRREDVFSTPKFIKIIVDPTPHNLRIPPEFMKRHGRNLGNRVFLKVPSTTVSWDVELVHSNGETLLQKGWKEFAQSYSLSFGHFLMFEYNGNSQFNVLIFDRTATKIDYPDFEAEPSGTESDDSIQVLEHLSSTKPKPKIVPDSGTRVPQSKKKRKKSSLFGRVEKETFMAYQRATGFVAGSTFLNPFFISIMHPSYIFSAENGLEIPKPFVTENMSACKSSSVNLRMKNDKKKVWPIKLYRYLNRVRLSSRGWKDFVKDNGLKVGDACIFEVCKDSHWNVIIFKS